MHAEIPTRLEGLLGFSTECPCGKTHSVELRSVSIRPGALDDVVGVVHGLGAAGAVALVADRITQVIAGASVAKRLAAAGHRVEVHLLSDGAGQRPHADEASVELLLSSLGAADVVVAVGSGTVNDVAKLSSYRRGIPYVTVATAPSMNGYTSAIAAIMARGVKRTVACHQPVAVVADLDILCQAPLPMILSGLGDLESKPTATADYRLGGQVRADYYCAAPEAVVLEAEARVAQSASALGRRDPAAIAELTEALLLSGISMKLAGSSSPASGAEHLISHYWDMTASEEGRLEGLHGAQVGVATIVSSALFERLQEISPSQLDPARLLDSLPSRADLERLLEKRHGPRAEEVSREFFSKHKDRDALCAELEWIVNHWDSLWAELRPVLRPASKVRAILDSAGAPVTVQAIDLTPRHLRGAFLCAREIRGRYTILDFADELGLLEPLMEEILTASGCLG